MSDSAPDIMTFEDVDERFHPLVERLRRLEWPQPPPGVRERTLERLRRHLEESGGPGEPPATSSSSPPGPV